MHLLNEPFWRYTTTGNLPPDSEKHLFICAIFTISHKRAIGSLRKGLHSTMPVADPDLQLSRGGGGGGGGVGGGGGGGEGALLNT